MTSEGKRKRCDEGESIEKLRKNQRKKKRRLGIKGGRKERERKREKRRGEKNETLLQ